MTTIDRLSEALVYAASCKAPGNPWHLFITNNGALKLVLHRDDIEQPSDALLDAPYISVQLCNLNPSLINEALASHSVLALDGIEPLEVLLDLAVDEVHRHA